MTREEAKKRAEAIKGLQRLSKEFGGYKPNEEMFEMAIEALQEQKTGYWIPWKAYYGEDRKSWSDELKCSECGYKWGDEEYKFCPSCGSRNRGEEE